MRLVLDASVAVAAERIHETGHAAARERIVRVLSGLDEIVVPPIFQAEVSGALARRGHDSAKIRAYVEALTAAPNQVRTFGPRASRFVADAAVRHKLRGADACYAWVALREGLPLCTLDRELADRGGSLCTIIGP